MFKFLLQAIAFSSTASAVPACVIACAAEAAGYGSDCQNLVDFECIISKQSSTLDSCLSQRCPDVDAAKQAVSSIATEFNVSDNSTSTAASSSSTAASSSVPTSSAIESTTSAEASSIESVASSSSVASSVASTEVPSIEASSTAAPNTTISVSSSAAPTSAGNTTLVPIEPSSTTDIPVANEGCISGNGVAAVAAVAMAAAALL